MSKVKVGVVGVGALGEHHARIYAELPQAELVAVVDVKEERAREIAGRFGCRAWTDFRELLPQVQAISLAVPTHLHARVGIPFLLRGCHMLVEKPMARTLEEADQLAQAAEEGGAILLVGHSERFNPALQAVLPYLSRPLFFEAHRLGVFVPRSLDIDVVLDLMIHDLDLILHLARCPVREIRAVGIPVLTPRVDIANARIELEDGRVANLTASRVSKEKVRKLRFFQPHDYISLDFHRQEVNMYSLVEEGGRRNIRQRDLEIRKGEPLREEILDFLKAVGEPGYQPRGCRPAEGKEALRLALEILEQIQAGSTPGERP